MSYVINFALILLQWCEGSVWNSSQYGEGLQGWEPFSVIDAAPLIDPQWLFGQVVYQNTSMILNKGRYSLVLAQH